MMTAEELNEAGANGAIDEIIQVAEARQRKNLSKIADAVCAREGVRVVLLAGGSSSGKTTTAMRLCTQLRVNERAALRLSTDDYFVGDRLNPRDADGNFDYEHVDCVDCARLVRDIGALLAGEPVPRRRFDFAAHEPVYSDEWLSLAPGGVIVLEGIHALNPRLSEGLDPKTVFRLAIDPKPNLDVFGGFTPSSADARLLRRLVRDNQFRKTTPEATFGLWPNVLAGEKKWIDPFRPLADAVFDSYLVYELAVLKPYVGGLLERARRALGERRDILQLIGILKCVHVIDASKVPGDSILRETIGGSQLEY